ncbi:transcription-repair coupling factor [Priestia taiwanensis]|uniref:Transcription-repair-coupling factor n=1 Tax=Priestia taiwanensis TaxID=1347902 RepID=A0A917EUC1_9BACI|nr:transcription-repair coupling factor [Priestia taiwanensis]MBM7365177.1 transcription-repair coupling factor (superfamily II helicase) [Priestia taiwanensis]GGE84690.1 transcription-repair-coupling factor [Priestia taiwanensis]
MLHLLRAFHGNKEIESLFTGLSSHVKEQLVTGLTGSSRTIMLATMYKETKRSQVVVTYNLLQAQKLYEDLVSIIGEEHVWLYPVNELIASEIGVASPELKAQRLEVLNFLCTNQTGIIIVPIAGLRRFLPSKESWKESQLSLSVGEEIEVDALLHRLVEMGYERKEMVEAPGTFSIRGGIVDIYPLTEALPIRMELFDSEIDSIRSFAPEDQRSQEKLSRVDIGPAAEYILSKQERERGLVHLQQKLAFSIQQAKYAKQKEALAENIGYEIAKLKNGQQIEQVFKYLSLFYEKPASLLDYVPDDTVIILDEISRVSETAEQLVKEEAEWYTSLLESGEIVRDVSFSHEFIQLLQGSKRQIVYLSLFTRHVAHTHPQNTVHATCKTMQEFYGQMHLFKAEIERWKKAKYTVLLLCVNEERVKKLESILADYEIEVHVISAMDPLLPGKVGIMIGDLNAGFELPMQKLAVITEKELFKKKIKKQQRKQKMSNAERIKSYSELKVGDHVVHINHGIGKFLGIETLEINGIHKDYLHVKYQGNDKLYVPVEQIDQVQKYIGAEGKEPKIYKLGGTEWKKVRTKVERSVQDIADDLIKLYAEREATKGYPFSPDGAEQQEFESSFPYPETEDQLRSIEEIKKDMERERPMDRLLCGDVGYGKTEVAIRAAFKAVMDGKQVAILVPTTILAQQHYETIKERFQEFPVEIGLMNRFRTRKQQSETIQGLKEGTVDVVIGTHRLLSKDVTYKDLGLLIIDEEQRFGVTHKEKIKQLKTNIDVLTLTATPIPRTLHMSMLGVRDLSVIETPPENRFPVQTYVVEYNEVLTREAIERELARDGQVYFLHNRVEDIERKAEEIAALVPDARVTYAHGRMNENELESVILDFLDRQYDVLVSTTIIETGVDIPNVNTLIVNDADRMGLSQLYQLRGRVGRSNRVAYSYFTYKKDKSLTEVAEKRLQSMKEFTELGSGFKIAMRDLSIRGAGNLLGAAQHGFIDSVGFDLYSQMLKDAIEERKGTIDEQLRREVDFDMEVDAYIPETYISDSKQKVGMYKQFKDLTSIEELESLQEEMIDRFGDYPIEVGYLFQVSYIKLLARMEKLQSVKQVKEEITLLCSAEATSNLDVSKLFELVSTYGKAIGLGTEGANLKLVIDKKGLATSDWLTMIENVLKGLANAKKESVNVL